MKQGRTLQELAIELERQRSAKRDFKTPVEQLKMTVETVDEKPEVALAVNGFGDFGVTPIAHDQIGQYTGIPAKYYDRMLGEKPDLLARNVNTWLETKKETRLVRTLDGDARALLSNRYRCIDNDLIAQAALETLLAQGSGLRVESCEVTDRRLYIKAVSERVEAKIKGQVVQAGITISNSEVGLHAAKTEPFILVLACLNGAILPKGGLRRFHIGRHTDEANDAFEVFADDTRKADDRALMFKLRDTIRASFDQLAFSELTKALSITANNQIERQLPEAVETAVEVLGLPEIHVSGILTALAKGGDVSQWGVSNAITAYAQDAAHTYEVATELERAGGEVLMLPAADWQKIAAKKAA